MINIHCDGACIDNGRPNAAGGYGYVVEEDGVEIYKKYGKLRNGLQTNNRAELEAMLYSLTFIVDSDWEGSRTFCIYTDSKTVVDGIVGIAKRKANRDIWIEIEELIKKIVSKHGITVMHCNKDALSETSPVYKFNVMADQLAFKGANALLLCDSY